MASIVLESSLLAASVQVLLDKLTRFGQNYVSVILDVEDEFMELKREVVMVEALVDRVTIKQQQCCYSSQRTIELWVNDLYNVLHNAEDLLDEIDLDIMKVNFESDLNELTTEDERRKNKLRLMANEIVKIKNRLESMSREMDALFTTNVANITQPNFVGNLQTSSLVKEHFVIGRQNTKNEIKKMLLLDESKDGISVIPIVGMGGIGKTTVAQLVYNDEEIVNHFRNSRFWVSISIEDTVEKITNLIFESILLEPTKLRLSNLDNAQTRIQSELSTRSKFLMVFDGMWDENVSDWDLLFLPFRYVAKGSKILVTTRSRIVSRIVSEIPPYVVQTLCVEECWNVVRQRALPCTDNNEHKKLEDIGVKIAEKCKGLPLAAKALGHNLLIKSKEMEWQGVLKSRLWDLEFGVNEMFCTLKMSYDCLPFFLKRCFSYCSIFPHNFKFKRDEVVQLWVAEYVHSAKKNEKTRRYWPRIF